MLNSLVTYTGSSSCASYPTQMPKFPTEFWNLVGRVMGVRRLHQVMIALRGQLSIRHCVQCGVGVGVELVVGVAPIHVLQADLGRKDKR